MDGPAPLCVCVCVAEPGAVEPEPSPAVKVKPDSWNSWKPLIQTVTPARAGCIPDPQRVLVWGSQPHCAGIPGRTWNLRSRKPRLLSWGLVRERF